MKEIAVDHKSMSKEHLYEAGFIAGVMGVLCDQEKYTLLQTYERIHQLASQFAELYPVGYEWQNHGQDFDEEIIDYLKKHF